MSESQAKMYFIDEERVAFRHTIKTEGSWSGRQIQVDAAVAAKLQQFCKDREAVESYLGQLYTTNYKHQGTIEVPEVLREEEQSKSTEGREVRKQVRGGGRGRSKKAGDSV